MKNEYFERVQDVNSTIDILYETMAGEQGEARPWDLYKYLFWKDAVIIRYEKDLEGVVRPQFMTPDEYVNTIGKWMQTVRKTGFYEREICNKTEVFGPIAHVWSTSESFHSLEDKEPYVRNIHSFQMVYHEGRWWIVSLYWTRETPENPIPEKYLPLE